MCAYAIPSDLSYRPQDLNLHPEGTEPKSVTAAITSERPLPKGTLLATAKPPRGTGIEPVLTVLETVSLPLTEPLDPNPLTYRRAYALPLHDRSWVAGLRESGIEPPTEGLKGLRSAPELFPHRRIQTPLLGV